MSLKLKIGYSQIMGFIFYFFRHLMFKNWGKILFGICILFSLGWFLNTPVYRTKSDKIEFEKSDNGKVYYFIKTDDTYHSVLLDDNHIKSGNYIDSTRKNENKLLLGFLFLCLLITQGALIMEDGWKISFSDSQRFAIINISKFEVDDDGIYNCVVFGRTYYKLYPNFLALTYNGRVSSYLPVGYAPTLWEIKHLDQFRNRSVDRNNKLSMLGI